MLHAFEILMMPGLAGGLLAGGGGAYLLGVRDPFLIGLAAVVLGLLGMVVVDMGIRRRRRV